jgi:hypothetical protein
MKNLRTLSIALTISLGLAACGGGGGSTAKTPTPPTPPPVAPVVITPFSMSVASTVSTLAENESGQITFSYKDASGDVTLTIDSYSSSAEESRYTVTGNGADKTVTISLNELIQDDTLSFVVTGKDGAGNSDTETITLSLTNPSVTDKITQLSTLSAAIPSALSGEQERRILNTLLDLGKLTKSITVSSANTRTLSIDDAFDPIKKSAIEAYIGENNWATRYNSKALNESDIDAAVIYLNDALVDYLASINTLLQATQTELTDTQIPAFSFGQVFLSDDGALSQFWGNPEMGNDANGDWQFASNYAYLTALIFPQSQTCNPQG